MTPDNVEKVREALKASVVAIDDWLNLYASEFCDEKRVEEAKARIREHSTLGYIADTQKRNREALALLSAPAPRNADYARGFEDGQRNAQHAADHKAQESPATRAEPVAEVQPWNGDKVIRWFNDAWISLKDIPLGTKLYAAPASEAPRPDGEQEGEQAVDDDLVTRESALEAIDHISLYNGPGRDNEAADMLVAHPPRSQQEQAWKLNAEGLAKWQAAALNRLPAGALAEINRELSDNQHSQPHAAETGSGKEAQPATSEEVRARTLPHRYLPTYGSDKVVPFTELAWAVGDARGDHWEPTSGHDMAGVNMNSLHRIVTYFVLRRQAAPQPQGEWVWVPKDELAKIEQARKDIYADARAAGKSHREAMNCVADQIEAARAARAAATAGGVPLLTMLQAAWSVVNVSDYLPRDIRECLQAISDGRAVVVPAPAAPSVGETPQAGVEHGVLQSDPVFFERELGEAMQEVWDDHVADTGNFPPFIILHRNRTVSARLDRSLFASHVAAKLAIKLRKAYAPHPDANEPPPVRPLTAEDEPYQVLADECVCAETSSRNCPLHSEPAAPEAGEIAELENGMRSANTMRREEACTLYQDIAARAIALLRRLQERGR